MEISALIPVFNRQDLATRAIHSVLRQGFDNLEVIVVDDASSPPFELDDTFAQDKRIRVIRHAVNKGAAAARNSAIDAAEGDYLAFLDSDDVWIEGKLQQQLNALREHENSSNTPAALVCGFNLKTDTSGREINLVPIESRSLEDFVSGCWYCPGSTLFIRKSVFRKIGPYDEDLSRLEDLDWFIRFAVEGGILLTLNGIYCQIAPGPKPAPDLVFESCMRITEKFASYARPQCRLTAKEFRYLKAFLALVLASAYVARSNYLSSAYFLTKSFVLKPRLQLQLRKWWN